MAMEAENQGRVGLLGVLSVISNRSLNWKKTRLEICLSPKQFSCWNDLSYVLKRIPTIKEETLNMCDTLIDSYSRYADPTNGATHYLNIELTKKLRGGTLPDWVEAMIHTATIGDHDFYKE
jgi:Cell Wall Hydrolase